MYQDFDISTIVPSLQDKCVYINFSMDVDPDTVNDFTVEIYDRATQNTLKSKLATTGKEVKVVLDAWPVPNTDYVIVVQNIKNVLGDILLNGARRTIVFKSDITSKLAIQYPSYDEVITDLVVKWIEWNLEANTPSLTPVGCYRIQISPENSFYTMAKDLYVTPITGPDGDEIRTELDISDIQNGQYYLRGRVEKDLQYGAWSNITTFVVGDESSLPGPVVDPTDPDPINDEPIFYGGIRIVTTPSQGETPGSFTIEFDKDIDPELLAGITIVRRSI